MLKDRFGKWKTVYTNITSSQNTERSYSKSIDAMHSEMLKMGYYPPLSEAKWDDEHELEYLYYNNKIIGFVDFDY